MKKLLLVLVSCLTLGLTLIVPTSSVSKPNSQKIFMQKMSCKGLFGSNETAKIMFFGKITKKRFNLLFMNYRIKRSTSNPDWRWTLNKTELIFNQHPDGEFFKKLKNLKRSTAKKKWHVLKFKKPVPIPRGITTKTSIAFGPFMKDPNNCNRDLVF